MEAYNAYHEIVRWKQDVRFSYFKMEWLRNLLGLILPTDFLKIIH